MFDNFEDWWHETGRKTLLYLESLCGTEGIVTKAYSIDDIDWVCVGDMSTTVSAGNYDIIESHMG